jgi:hypothetical protein
VKKASAGSRDNIPAARFFRPEANIKKNLRFSADKNKKEPL